MALPSHISPAPASAHSRTPTYALVGNPNCGKSTLFNALTGLKQKVGNYPGVTVEKKIGVTYSQHGQPITVIDLPGSYSLAARSPDEAVTRDVLLGVQKGERQPDALVVVVDASNLDNHLRFALQLLPIAASESQYPYLICPENVLFKETEGGVGRQHLVRDKSGFEAIVGRGQGRSGNIPAG